MVHGKMSREEREAMQKRLKYTIKQSTMHEKLSMMSEQDKFSLSTQDRFD